MWKELNLRINTSENPSDVFPSLEEEVKVTLNSKTLPSVVLPSMGKTWDGSDPHSAEEGPPYVKLGTNKIV